MTTDFKTPGVYIQEISKFPPSVAAVETAIPVFIGYTENILDPVRGDLTKNPQRISSMVEYETLYGSVKKEGAGITVTTTPDNATITVTVDPKKIAQFKMYYSLQFYFANGGGPCYITTVGNYDTDGGLVNVTKLQNGLSLSNKIDEVTLILFPDAQALTTTDYYDLQVAALQSSADLQDRFVIMDVYNADAVVIEDALDTETDKSPIGIFRNRIGVDNLKYGAAYYPNVETSLDFIIDDTKVTVNGKTLDTIKTGNNALYFQIIAAISNTPMVMTPSAGMAGIYANVDSTRGVWKAPANVNMSRVIRPTIIVSDDEQKTINVDVKDGKSINVIRSFTGRGPGIVWGARTLAGNDNEWRYVSVRRFCNMVEESVKNACGQFVFEPNDANTWVRVRAMIENFLILQWRAGALQGAKPDKAFYVAVGLNQTMTGMDILEGRMIVEIGMAIVRPAEFIILRFSQMMPE